jgi:hypothetical protein
LLPTATARLDALAKGIGRGNVDELGTTALALAGAPALPLPVVSSG